MPSLSLVLTNFNEAANLRGVLHSVDFADEIIVVDGGSTDNSRAVARAFGAKLFTRENSRQLNLNKNFGFDNSHCDWILVLDTDERVPSTLGSEIKDAICSEAYEGYLIKRRNFLGRKWLAHGGWYPDEHFRLFRRGKARFECRHVHEELKVDGKIGKLTNPIDHLTYRNFGEYLSKFMRYTLFESEVFLQFGAKRKYPYLRFLAVEPIRIFLNMYILKTGYLDGGEGLIACFFSALYPAVSYLRYRLRV